MSPRLAVALAFGVALAAETCAASPGARAQDADELPRLGDCPGERELAATGAPRRAAMELEGAPGVWLRLDVARCVLRDVEAGRAFRDEAEALRRANAARREEAEALRRALALAREAEERASEREAEARADAARARESAGAWHRSRALWLAVGAALALGFVLALGGGG